MRTLEDTSLTFAKECLGWADAKVVYSQDQPDKPRFVVLSPTASQDTLFAPADWADVKAVTAKWGEETGREVAVTNAQGIATATVSGPGGSVQASNPSVCQAVLTACVLAHRG